MLDFAITWSMHHPLPCVGVLVALSALVGLLLMPALHDVPGAPGEHHPRC